MIEASWARLNEVGEGASERAILLVRLHIQDPPIEDARSFLDQVSRSAPDDDRGWLGQAKLAIRDGAFDKAARWLDACVRRRADGYAGLAHPVGSGTQNPSTSRRAPGAGAPAGSGVKSG